ncbi:hypothetical protein LTR86_003828 [Recurvomyces mirabilis]|nr:hypothetical protein LTR86_003828 [Recurvomyces mirabilis]
MSDFLAYGAFRNGAYPIELCVDFKTVEGAYIPWLFTDQAFVSSVLFSSSAMYDFLRGRQLTTATLYRLRQTIVLLNARLAWPESQCSDSTLYIVITLAMLAAMFGEKSAAAKHLAGLSRIVELRGGRQFLLRNTKKHYKLSSMDLIWSAHAGSALLFPCDELSWSGALVGPRHYNIAQADLEIMPPQTDTKLCKIYDDLSYLSRLLNEAFGRGQKLEGDSFQHWFSSIQSRLVDLKCPPDDSSSECIRLGMIAYLSATFQLPGRRMQLQYLASNFCRALLTSFKTSSVSGPLLQWLVVVGVATVFDARDPWIQEAWRSSNPGIESWDEIRAILESVMWISCVHDGPGKQAFTALNRPASEQA